MAGSTVPSFSTALVALVVFGLRCARAAVPLEVYGHLPQLEDVALSPDGERAALIQTQGDHRFIVIESLTEHKMLKVIAAGDQKVRSIRWADDDHLMIVTSMTLLPEGLEGHRGEWYTLQVYDVARGTKRIVPNLEEEHRFGTQATVMNVVVGDVQIRTIDGHTVLFVPGLYASDTDLLRALFRVDLQNNQTTLMLKGNREARDWLIDQSGQLAARFDYDSEHRQWQVGIRQGGKWVDAAISGQEAIDIPELQGFTNDSNAVLMRVVDHGKTSLRPLNLQQGKLGDALPLQGQTVIYDRTTDRMIGASFDDGARYRFLDAAYQGHWDAITRAYAGEQVHLISFADGFQKAVISVEGARDGYAYVVIDLAAKRAFPIGDIYQGLPQLMPVKEIEYPAADGLKIPAYLTLPSGRDPKALALVVLPHGGPATHEDGSFDWWSQALASQGYAVLQPNFRGSTLGWDFMSAGFGEVGRKMQTDLSDGVHYLVEQGIVDPKRVCIVGASYGGYAALAGVSLFPGIYRCAVSVAGMSDLSRMMKFDDEFGYGEANRTTRYWDRFLGVHGATDPVLDSISPLKHVKSVDVPVLMIHGTDDTVVAFEQSQDMYKALTQLGKPVELIRLNHEDHWLSSSDTRLQMLQATVDFLRKHSPSD